MPALLPVEVTQFVEQRAEIVIVALEQTGQARGESAVPVQVEAKFLAHFARLHGVDDVHEAQAAIVKVGLDLVALEKPVVVGIPERARRAEVFRRGQMRDDAIHKSGMPSGIGRTSASHGQLKQFFARKNHALAGCGNKEFDVSNVLRAGFKFAPIHVHTFDRGEGDANGVTKLLKFHFLVKNQFDWFFFLHDQIVLRVYL